MIFQDPMTSLNPFLKISTQLMEVTRLHLGHTKEQARGHAIKMLKTGRHLRCGRTDGQLSS